MANLRAAASTGRLRVYGTSLSDDGALPWEEREQDTSLLLLQIGNHFKAAIKFLTAGSNSDLLRLIQKATCVGLLDPFNNILMSAALAPIADPVDETMLVGMAQRSFDGLVAFLTCFFPHLTDWEAVMYLVLAEADPLVAARMVIEDRRTKCFRPGSAATNGALKLALNCATVAAKYPWPSVLAGLWLSLCSNDVVVALLSAFQHNQSSDISHKLAKQIASVNQSSDIFHKLAKQIASVNQSSDISHKLAKQIASVPFPAPGSNNLLQPWERAASRRKHTTKVTHQYSWSLRRVLLHTIHGFYLQALARMPGRELRSRYHRSMLKAGHCYGPFDPVTNIIVNTIWYEVTFPPLSQLDELDILGTLNLMRIEAQSFYGLVSFLCTHDKDLNADQAIRILLDTDLNLAATKHRTSVQDEQEAFKAAATAAWHPRPDAQAAFLSSCKTPAVLSLLSDNGGQQQLSSQCVQQLAMLLSSAFRSTGMLAHQKQPVAIYKRRFELTMYEGRIQRRAHKRISRKIRAALSRYEVQNSEQACYQLHVVCGVNTYVSGPDESMHSIMMQKKKDPVEDDYYHHTHANFLVTRNVGSVGSVPVLFFAELSNKNDDQDSQLLCCPVEFPLPGAEPVRCLFCEQEGIRIVHPANGEGFHGHEVEFGKMVRGEDLFENVDYPEEYDNDRILTNSEFVTDTVADGLEEDCMYLGSDDFTIKESDGHEWDEYGEE